MPKVPELAEDLVPIGQFKSQASSLLKSISEDERTVVITQNGRAAAVVMSPREFDRIQYQRRFVEEVAQGLADADAGAVSTTTQVKRRLAKRRKA